MKPATKLGIGLGLIVALYFVALGLGLWINEGDSREAPAWTEALADLGGGLAPRMPLGRLRCNGQPVDDEFVLTEADNSCVIDMPRDGRHDYRKAELRVVGTSAPSSPVVYLEAAYDEEFFPREDADPACHFENDTLDSFHVKVVYEPAEESEGDLWDCWLERKPGEAITLTVLSDGGKLTLTCEGCSMAEERDVILRLE